MREWPFDKRAEGGETHVAKLLLSMGEVKKLEPLSDEGTETGC